MELFEAAETFSSLAQETRLRVFKLLIRYGQDGLIPSKIAEELNIPDNTLSFHLAHLSKAGLVRAQKSGRNLTYFANTERVHSLIAYLQENCCVDEKSKSGKPRKC